MKYQEAMSVLSQSGLGALVMESDSRILAVNQAGDALLHGAGKLEGKLLSEIALPLSMESEKPMYATVVFGEYLRTFRCSSKPLSCSAIENWNAISAKPTAMCWMCFMHMTGRAMCGNKYI